jgi:hypothetical protein
MHVLGIIERVYMPRAIVLGLAPDSGAEIAEVALADRSIILPLQPKLSNEVNGS